jgi:Spy/CpxP family protein refolding chaperone
LKRKFEENTPKTGPIKKQPRLLDVQSIMNEEEMRREDRNKKSLFVKGVAKKMNSKDLKLLHPDIQSVRIIGAHAWLIFPNEAACEKAYAVVRDKKFEGKPMVVDFCGSKSKNGKIVSALSVDEKSSRPIDPLQIIVAGLPKSMTREQMHVLFPNAKNINVLNKYKAQNSMAFIKFDDEAVAKEAFEKNANLTVKGMPVDVYFARVLIPKEKRKNIEPAKEEKQTKKPAVALTPKQQKIQEKLSSKVENSDDEDDNSEALESSDEEIDDEEEDLGDEESELIESSNESLEESDEDDDE